MFEENIMTSSMQPINNFEYGLKISFIILRNSGGAFINPNGNIFHSYRLLYAYTHI